MISRLWPEINKGYETVKSVFRLFLQFQKLSNERSYKFSLILTLTEVISIMILRMRLISTIMNFN